MLVLMWVGHKWACESVSPFKVFPWRQKSVRTAIKELKTEVIVQWDTELLLLERDNQPAAAQGGLQLICLFNLI